MEEVIKKYKEWKKDKDEDYIYDETYSFLSSLYRGELDKFMRDVEKIYDDANKDKT